MIYFKIYCTLILVTLIVAGVTWLLMDIDDKRSDLWFKISIISWITTSVMIIVEALTVIWFFD
jgi:heme/copper-type cytochrome/quinol oxidase subunit 2